MLRRQNPQAIVLCELFFCAHYTSPLFSNYGLYFYTTKQNGHDSQLFGSCILWSEAKINKRQPLIGTPGLEIMAENV